MKPKFVDTNIFVEIVSRRGSKSDRCLRLLEGETSLWTTDLVINELDWVLRSFYDLEKEKIVESMRHILNLRSLSVLHRSWLMEALEIYATTNVDYTDCYDWVLAREEGINEVYSFDRHFDKIPGIKRRGP